MSKKILFVLFLLACLIAPAAAAGGSGTAANPYIIETAAELQSIQNNLGAYYRLANDIDLSGVTWTPIGSRSAGFFGELDGDGYKISNLDLSSNAEGAALFTSLTSGATIKDLTLEDCHVETTDKWSGCLIGSIIMSESAHDTATLQNIDMVRCSATTSINNAAPLCSIIYTDSVVEIIDCSFIGCSAECETTGAGIICGMMRSTISVTITGCTITDSNTKSGTYGAGIISGLMRYTTSVTITGCTITDSYVESTSYGAGLIFGSYDGSSSTNSNASDITVENSIVKGENYVGGLFGRITGTGSSSSITNCAVTDCTIEAISNYAGGIGGIVQNPATANIESCTVTDSTILAPLNAAGICPSFS